MTNIIKRIISKRSKVRTFEYTGGSASIPKNVTHVQFHPGVTEVHDEAFKDCSKLKEIVLSDSITNIGKGSFQGCTKLKKIVLNHGLIQIGHDAFANCSSIKSITFPSTVTKIGDRALKDCSSLKQIIHMNEGVGIKYGWDVFHGCQLAMRTYRIKKIMEACHLKELEHKIDEEDSTIQLRDGNITILLTQANLPSESNYKSRDKICNLIQYYVVKEATTLFELALWKAKINQADEEVYPTNRDACRVEVPGPAKDLILKYAYTIPMYTATCYRICIKCSRGEELMAMKVEPYDTIADVKNEIHDEKDIPVDQQHFFFNGSELLHDDRTLSNYNILTDSIIYLVVFGD